MKHFSYAAPSGTAVCEAARCPCSNEPIEPGSGYLYISNHVVKQRRDEPGNDGATPVLLCREAARKRDLDLEVAAEDAANWWETGSVALRATPRRELKFADFKGESVEEAEQLARETVGDGLLGTDVVKDVRQMSATAQGNTADEAVATVMTRIPAGAFDARPAQILQEGTAGEVEVTEREESEAKRSWRRKAPRGAQLDAIECKQTPKSGVVGIGKRPGIWIARWSAPYIAEVCYKTPAVVTARFFG